VSGKKRNSNFAAPLLIIKNITMKKFGFIIALLVFLLGLGYTIYTVVEGLYVEMAFSGIITGIALMPVLITLLKYFQKNKGVTEPPPASSYPAWARLIFRYAPYLAGFLAMPLGIIFIIASVLEEFTSSLIIFSIMTGTSIASVFVILINYKQYKARAF
jgi:hypothetical protein